MPQYEKPQSFLPGRTHQRGRLKITIGDVRVIMRGQMFPWPMIRFFDGSVLMSAQVVEGKGPMHAVRSEDKGATWRPLASSITWDETEPGRAYATPGIVETRSGKTISLSLFTTPIAGRPGYYATTRWESCDQGRTISGPLTDGTLYLPPDQFDPACYQWFHGNMIQASSGELLAAMQGVEAGGTTTYPFRVFIARSEDEGRSWRFLAHVMSLGNLDNPQGRLHQGWTLHGPCEPAIEETDDGEFFCVARTVNDDSNPPLGPATDTYSDLNSTVEASGIAFPVPPGKYYGLSQPSAPLVCARSTDGGRSWSRPQPMQQARGCFPRLARSGSILAMTYGAIAFPRWGNCISFSLDGGRSWTEEINFGPFLTTGYPSIVMLEPGRFLVAFDCTPPQPFRDHIAHWVGVADVVVEVAADMDF
jgi:hypothetical protein